MTGNDELDPHETSPAPEPLELRWMVAALAVAGFILAVAWLLESLRTG